MNLKDIMLIEINQIDKDKYCVTSFIWRYKRAELTKAKGRMMVTRDWGTGK